LPRPTKKIGELWSTNNKILVVYFHRPTSNSARDFGELEISIANISGTDRAIDKRKTALSTTFPPMFYKKLVNLGPLQSYRRLFCPTQNQHCAFNVSWWDCIRHVALLGAEFQTPKSTYDIGPREASPSALREFLLINYYSHYYYYLFLIIITTDHVTVQYKRRVDRSILYVRR